MIIVPMGGTFQETVAELRKQLQSMEEKHGPAPKYVHDAMARLEATAKEEQAERFQNAN